MTTEKSQQNPVRFTLAHLEETVGHLKDHAKHCVACDRPGKKMRAAFNEALYDTGAVMLDGFEALAASMIRIYRDGASTAEARAMAANALATHGMLSVVLAAKLTARVHDEEPNMVPFDTMRTVLTPLADLFDADQAKRH